jgi:hypothetical protein
VQSVADHHYIEVKHNSGIILGCFSCRFKSDVFAVPLEAFLLRRGKI